MRNSFFVFEVDFWIILDYCLSPTTATPILYSVKCFFFLTLDNPWLSGVGSTQETYSYQCFFGKRILCCLNTLLLLCTHQAQKLLNLGDCNKQNEGLRVCSAYRDRENFSMYKCIPSI